MPTLRWILLLMLILSCLVGCAGRSQGAGDAAGKIDKFFESADNYSRMDRPDLALLEYDKALAAGGPKAEINVRKGDTQCARKAWGDALRAYQAALEADPENALAMQGIGIAKYMLSEVKGAEDYLQKALARRNDLGDAWFFLGLIHNRSKKPEEALQAFERALEIQEGSAETYNSMGISLYMLGQYDAAIEAFQSALSYSDARKISNNLGLALCQLRLYDLALDYFKAGGGEAMAYNNVGCFLLREGRARAAISSFEKAITLHPSFYKKAHDNLSRAKLALQQASGSGFSNSAGEDLPAGIVAEPVKKQVSPAKPKRLPIKEVKIEGEGGENGHDAQKGGGAAAEGQLDGAFGDSY